MSRSEGRCLGYGPPGDTVPIVESNYELMAREPRKNCKKAFYDVFLLYHI